MTTRVPTGEIPFKLTFSTEAIILGQCQKNLTEQLGILNECLVVKSSPRSSIWPSHHGIVCEMEWGQMEKKNKMP